MSQTDALLTDIQLTIWSSFVARDLCLYHMMCVVRVILSHITCYVLFAWFLLISRAMYFWHDFCLYDVLCVYPVICPYITCYGLFAWFLLISRAMYYWHDFCLYDVLCVYPVICPYITCYGLFAWFLLISRAMCYLRVLCLYHVLWFIGVIHAYITCYVLFACFMLTSHAITCYWRDLCYIACCVLVAWFMLISRAMRVYRSIYIDLNCICVICHVLGLYDVSRTVPPDVYVTYYRHVVYVTLSPDVMSNAVHVISNHVRCLGVSVCMRACVCVCVCCSVRTCTCASVRLCTLMYCLPQISAADHNVLADNWISYADRNKVTLDIFR